MCFTSDLKMYEFFNKRAFLLFDIYQSSRKKVEPIEIGHKFPNKSIISIAIAYFLRENTNISFKINKLINLFVLLFIFY